MMPSRLLWLAVVVMLWTHGDASALDPHRTIAQYLRDSWTAENGFPGGQVSSFAQTPDGCLWIGGEKGLVRFDGASFRLVQESSKGVPITHVLGLATDGSGSLWVWMQGANVLRLHNGVFDNVISSLSLPDEIVTAMSSTGDGGVLLSTIGQETFEYRNGSLHKQAIVRVPGSLILANAKTADGAIWMGTSDNGLFSVVNGEVVRVAPMLKKINVLLPGLRRTLWIGTDEGLFLWDGQHVNSVPGTSTRGRSEILTLASDRDGDLWAGSAHGVSRLRATPGQTQPVFAEQAGAAPFAIFEDREGDLWIGSSQGIQRWRDGAFIAYSLATGALVEQSGTVLAAQDGGWWFGPGEGGLKYVDHAGALYDVPGFGDDVVYSIAGRGADLWIGRRRGGLTHLVLNGTQRKSRTYTNAEGLAQNSVYTVLEAHDGTVWAGTLNSGLSRLQSGVFKTFTAADGLASNTITALEEDGQHLLWAATPDGLSVRGPSAWRTYRTEDGLPSNEITALLQAQGGSNSGLWVGTAKGLALFSSGHLRTFVQLAPVLGQPVLGLAEDRDGFLWMATADQVLRFDRTKLVAGTLSAEEIRSFGRADGLPSSEIARRSRSIAQSTRGRILISTRAGLVATDPAVLDRAFVPSIVQMNGIIADGRGISAEPARIPASPQRITLAFAAVSLPVPERVRYRYRLDGFDKGWSEISSAREAVYTHLDPGSYRFRLLASNSDGAWNTPETSFPFTIEPALWQTWWFRLCSVLILLLAIRWMYVLRMRQLAKQLHLRFEERLAERMRIAQDLHDTLMQGFLSASMQLDVATDYVPSDSPAAPMLSRVLALMQCVSDETRRSLTTLRAPDRRLQDLETELYRIPKELGRNENAAYRVLVNGSPRPLDPVCSNEVYMIGREAVLNAYRHAEAHHIEVELVYESSAFRLSVLDDGKGIDQAVLHQGRKGHWGLSGMRERATALGATFKLWSRPLRGTEIELTVPGHIAYGHGKRKTPWHTLRKFPVGKWKRAATSEGTHG